MTYKSTELRDAAGLPLDWETKLRYAGVYRNKAQRVYYVRVGTPERQFHVGTAYSQELGAILYDKALWKLAGKIARPLRFNFPDKLADYDQDTLSRELPRLDEIYAAVPFLRASDSLLGEAELRGRRLKEMNTRFWATSIGESRYQVVMAKVARQQSVLAELFSEADSLPDSLALNKLPAITSQFHSVATSISQAAAQAKCLSDMLASHAELYEKIQAETPSV